MMPVWNCEHYKAPIAEIRHIEKSLVAKANHTNKHGTLMVINTKYRHFYSELQGLVQDQKYCYIAKKEAVAENKSWLKIKAKLFPKESNK